MAVVDFTTWTEVDVNSRLTVTSTTITQDDADRGDGSGSVYDDYTAGFWNGDFTFKMKMTTPASGQSTAGAWIYPLQVLNDVSNNPAGNESASADFQGCYFSNSSGNPTIRVFVVENGVRTSTGMSNLSWSTTYYLTLERDDDGGANSTGQLTLRMYTGNYYGEVGATEHDTATVDCGVGEQNDFRYIEIARPRGSGSGATDMFYEDFDDGLAGTVYVDMEGSSAGQSTTAGAIIGSTIFIEGSTAGQSSTSGAMGIAIAIAGTTGGQSALTGFLSYGPLSGSKANRLTKRLVAAANNQLYYEDI